MANLLLEEVGVAILPGVSFARKQSELTVRLSFINYDGEAALKAYNEGEEVNMVFLKKYCGDTVEGIEVLVKWLKSL